MLSEIALEKRREYQREYYSKNKEKRRKQIEEYWERKARKDEEQE